MGSSTTGPRRRRGLPLLFVTLPLLVLTFVAPPAPAAEMTLSSRTYLLYYEREAAGGTKDRFAPFYEYLSGDARSLGGTPVSFHFSGWGRQDLADDSGSGNRSGDLGSAYLQYLHPTGNAEARLGRFFLTEGAAFEIMDGLFVKVRTAPGLGISAFGGVPVERTITATGTGDSIYGGRVFFARAGFAELGASYLFEKGEFQGKDRKEIGGDLWVRPFGPVELIGRATYNESTRALADQRYVVRVIPAAPLDVSVGYEAYRYKDYFQTALNPAFLAPALDNSDRVRVVFAIVDWNVVGNLTLEAAAKDIRHDLADPGDARRGELGIRYAFNDHKDVVGVSGALVTADRKENEYREVRGFGSWSPGRFRFSLDLLGRRFKEAINGGKSEYMAVGSAGARLLSYLRLSGDLTYTQSPQFKNDTAGIIRASLDLGTGTGGDE
ncbi:MAG: hypothetical protein M1550_06435 [Deltaproteobacteria bacterium]|nr:hypothetical protein [Deltaproteobacteria bacterium]